MSKKKKNTKLEAIYSCSVKNLNDDERKVVSIRKGVYDVLKNEMDIVILETLKPEGMSPLEYMKKQRDYKSLPAEKPFVAASQKPVKEDELPDPPQQMMQRLPGETQGQFHGRRMKEGKAFRQWEKAYGVAYAERHGSLDKTETPATKRMMAGTATPTKEELEEASMAELMAAKKKPETAQELPQPEE